MESADNKYQTWLKVEIWACEAMAELGLIPKEAAEVIRHKAPVDADRVDEIELVTKHDVIAFLTNVAEHVGARGPIHPSGHDVLRRSGHRHGHPAEEGGGHHHRDIERFMEIIRRRPSSTRTRS